MKYERLSAEDEELFALLSGGLKKDKTGKGTVLLQNMTTSLTLEEGGEAKKVTGLDRAVCPFLSGDGLCVIQRKNGAEALSDTCKIFPRNISLTERGYEMSLTNLCLRHRRQDTEEQESGGVLPGSRGLQLFRPIWQVR